MICVETESIIIITTHAGEENLEDCDADKVETVVTDVLPSSVDVGISAATSQGMI